MKRLPVLLAGFFIALTLFRIAILVSVGFRQGWQGWFFSIGLAIGTFTSWYFLRHRSTIVPAILGILLFTIVDLLFNEMEIIRTLSPATLVLPNSNYLGINSNILEYGMQILALILGALPTFAAGVLGWMQAGAENIDWNAPNQSEWSFGAAIMAKLNHNPAQEPPLPQIEEIEAMPMLTQPATKRWDDLTADEKMELAANTPLWAAAHFHLKPRTARYWVKWARAGK
jgi:hypothetical protein